MARSLTWGCCPCCLTEEEKTAARIDQEINKILLEQKKQERGELKLLLLGECGMQHRDREREGLTTPEAAGTRLQTHFLDGESKASRSWVSHSLLSRACIRVRGGGSGGRCHTNTPVCVTGRE